MIQPLALVLYEKLLPGTQLINRLQDLNYRVRALTDAAGLTACAAQEKPMIALVDVFSTKEDIAASIRGLKQNADTGHIPVIAFGPEEPAQLLDSARQAGATLAVSEAAILTHLPQFLEQALQVE